MIETSGEMTGSFRIRSTGYFGDIHRQIVATFKRPSFLDYVYFTQLETSDPVTYGYPNPSDELTGAYKQCELTYEQGRYENPITGNRSPQMARRDKTTATRSPSSPATTINGPMHTNDAIAICGNPTFGRKAKRPDRDERAKLPAGTRKPATAAQPQIRRHADHLGADPGAARIELQAARRLAETGYSFKGQIHICLEGANMKVSSTVSDLRPASTLEADPLERRRLRRQRHLLGGLLAVQHRPTERRPRTAATSTSTAPTPAS